MIASSEVDSALICERSRKSTRPGTKSTPPPTPIIPLTTPAAKPMASAPMRSPASISAPSLVDHQDDRRHDQYDGEHAGDHAFEHPLLERRADHDTADGRHGHQHPLEHVHVAVDPLGRAADQGYEGDRAERGGGRGALPVAEPDDQERHDHRAASHPEHRAEGPRRRAY